ncbi:MAG: hypothetical protein E7573_07255 [Ruminococcaceae bacterium]|nr:hypothetical protein [Oscillospiraceae bacterium]MBR3598135.1 MFS transporter [Clostridia bacterium]
MDKKENTSSLQTKQVNVYENFNYVGVKESVAYVLNDVSNTFNINSFQERYIWDVVKVDFTVSAVVNIFTSAWDTINDILLGSLVDNTRTRLGKFRPYLIGLQVPLTLLGALYWMIPLFFPGTSGTHVPKLIFYFAFTIIQETASTAMNLAKGGYMSTTTPNPNERVRLITLAELFSGYLGEDLPRYIFGALYDLIVNEKIGMKLSTAFLTFGAGCSVISSGLTLYYFFQSKERVPQSIERPSIKEGLRAIFTNYPVLLMCLSDFLGGFSVSTSESNYFIDVFGSYSLITIANIPSSLNGSISYGFIPFLRKHFSSKALWVGADIYGDILSLGFFLFGMINRNYTKMIPMVVAVGIREWFYKWSFGVNKVINSDLWNEAMDFCEWKNGYRMEATTSVAKSLVLKIQSSLMNSVRSIILKNIGYVQGIKIGTQSNKTKFWLFALCSAVPTISGALGVIPKFLWPLTKEKREKMYKDLAERRNELVSTAN